MDETIEARRHDRQSDRGHGDRGASLVEYALLVALIAVVCIGAVTAFGTATGNSLNNSHTSIVSAN